MPIVLSCPGEKGSSLARARSNWVFPIPDLPRIPMRSPAFTSRRGTCKFVDSTVSCCTRRSGTVGGLSDELALTRNRDFEHDFALDDCSFVTVEIASAFLDTLSPGIDLRGINAWRRKSNIRAVTMQDKSMAVMHEEEAIAK